MSGWWIADYWQSGQTVLLASWIFWVIASICLHELGHGAAAIWEGDDTPRRTGHMTWNPMVHMGTLSIVLFLLVGFAYGLMPVDPRNFRHGRRGDALVAAAGPAVNLILGVVLLTSAGLVSGVLLNQDSPPMWATNIQLFLATGGWLNLVLLALNLLPIPILDGGQALIYSIEGIMRSPLSMRAREIANSFGFAVLVLLMSRAFWNDLTPFWSRFVDWLSGTAP